MGAVSFIRDRLTNVMSGMGTSADRSTAAFYAMIPVTPQQVEASYRSSWLMRKVVDLPPLDMTRAWRSWQAESNDITAIEREERRLQVKAKAKRALTLARLWGGGAIIIGMKDALPSEPIDLERVGQGDLVYLHTVGRHQLEAGPLVDDPTDDEFGKPRWFRLGSGTYIHPSRVIDFVGQRAPDGGQIGNFDAFWGDPLLQSIDRALKNADLAQDGFATLIDQAKLDIIKIPDMMANVGTQEYQDRLLARLAAANAGKSTWRALLLDGAEEWESRQVTWAGIPDIINAYLQLIAGAADIPVTRLLGQSPKGLQSTGDGERKDYHDMIAARQDELLAPALDRLDEILIRSALGKRPKEIWSKFNPLAQMDAEQLAKVESERAKALKGYADTGLFEDVALSVLGRNAIVEGGAWPGAEQAFDDADQLPDDDDPNGDTLTEAERLAAKGGGQVSAGEGGGAVEPRATPPRRAANDATPRALYVRRNLLNGEDLVKWAKANGFDTTLPAADMHVTVLYSRTPVDPMAMGETWSSEEDGGLLIKAGGPRALERFGEGAVVLQFASWSLESRHREMVERGASHDWPEYLPHVTLTYSAPDGFDPTAVLPFTGELRFGPEIFEPLDEEWKSRIEEA